MIWLGFTWTATEVERRLGLSWGAAQKLIIDACENEEMRWRTHLGSGPDVIDIDFAEWLKAKTAKTGRKSGGKQPRIKASLAKLFKGGPVPDRGDRPREALKGDLLKLDHTLHPLDLKTLRTAIESYNRELGNGRKS
jgi:hypothetical protein